MNEEQRAAFIVALVEGLSEESWVGKTHVQKATYFAQEAAGVGLGFRYVIHYYGPYSFELDSLIEVLASQEILTVSAEPDGYGYQVSIGDAALEGPGDTEVRNRAKVIAGYFRGLGTRELELLSTSFYVQRRLPDADSESQIQEVQRLKPRFTESEIASAIQESLAIAKSIAKA